MGTSENFSLQWNDFQNNLISSYRAVRKTEDFSDMTLVCEDGQQIAAHRIILSSSSTFFRDLLARNPHSHPLVYMRSVQYRIMASIVDFIYHGEAEVAKEELETFLEISGELSVKGMTKQEQVNSDKKLEEDTANEGKTVPQYEQNISGRHLEEKEEERFPCDNCGKTYGTKGSLRTHKYSHSTHIVQEITHKEKQDEMVKESFPCDECGKTYGSKASLRTHKYNHTKAPEPVKNEKVDILEMTVTEKNSNPSLAQLGLEEKMAESLDMSLDRSLDRSLDKSPIEVELEERIDAITELKEGLWTCIQCGKADKKRFHLRRHAETHIQGFSHPCTTCGKTFTQRAHLKGHKLSAHHEEKIIKQFG